MPSPILARADALMHRRRQGETGPLDDVPVLTDIVEPPEEFPLLEAAIGDAMPESAPPQPGDAEPQACAAAPAAAEAPHTDETVAPFAAAASAATPLDLTRTAIAQLADQIAERITARLQAELPTMIDDAIADILAEHPLPDLRRDA